MSLEFNPQTFSQNLATHVRDELRRAAEPLIRDVMAEIQSKLRERLALMVTTFVQSDFDIARDGRVVTIKVRLGNEKSG